ncbi:MAG: alanine--tRNA ligase [Eubacteriales bacterium]
MKWTSLNELREKYLSFFEGKGHLRLPSFPLVPQGDRSLLLINSGMAPMKKFFTGEERPPRTRVTTCQKCIRTPDLERVGHTARHGTYFEMLGNFSFGDYFKAQAIPWAWEFLTSADWLAIPAERLWVSVYEQDEEAYDLWRDVVGVPEARIVRLGKADNFWEHGIGPCGPCSEIYFDRGAAYGCGDPACKPGCDCDRFMEVWNNVFSQFNSDGAGNYTELAQKNIDTGMGLERLACVMQGVDNLFEVDTVRRELDTICAIAGKTYGQHPAHDVSIRVITDHVRGAVFMICDGVLPSNEGRGYVLRRLLRRAVRHGKLLGIDEPFLVRPAEVVIAENLHAYRELAAKQDYILKVIALEEVRFHATLDAGLLQLEALLQKTLSAGERVLDGEAVFRLYDTYGFPFDLTREMAQERGLAVDEETFRALMEAQKARARAARGNVSGWSEQSKTLLADLPKTTFLGYEADRCEAVVLAIFHEDSPVDSLTEGEGTLVLDRTVFYGEGGGQVGDRGLLVRGEVCVEVLDTQKSDGVYMHLCRMGDGTVRVGDTLSAQVDVPRREAIRRNHSACHLLQAALRRVLGTHVEQAGSYVDETRLRFDFSHYAALTDAELAALEADVNAHILTAQETKVTLTDRESARKMGAMALFGEKYGESVRVVAVGDASLELCGGTHVRNTGNIGLFKIISENSVAAGVRRIEATAGLGVLSLLDAKDRLIQETAHALKVASAAELPVRAAAMQEESRELRRSLESASAKLAEAQLAALLGQSKQIGPFRLLTARLDISPAAGRGLCDTVKAKYADMVAVFATVQEGKLTFVCGCGPDAVAAGAHAGKLLQEVSAVAGGKGGGRPDSAMSGGKDLSLLDAALAQAEQHLSRLS